MELLYANPVNFARLDPEWFSLIMTILQKPRGVR
jgi:hypothetical protein